MESPLPRERRYLPTGSSRIPWRPSLNPCSLTAPDGWWTPSSALWVRPWERQAHGRTSITWTTNLPLAFARAAHQQGAGAFALVSAIGATPSSRFFYPRTKGKTEEDIRNPGGSVVDHSSADHHRRRARGISAWREHRLATVQGAGSDLAAGISCQSSLDNCTGADRCGG